MVHSAGTESVRNPVGKTTEEENFLPSCQTLCSWSASKEIKTPFGGCGNVMVEVSSRAEGWHRAASGSAASCAVPSSPSGRRCSRLYSDGGGAPETQCSESVIWSAGRKCVNKEPPCDSPEQHSLSTARAVAGKQLTGDGTFFFVINTTL